MNDKERDDFLKQVKELTQKCFPDLLNSPGAPALPDDDADDWDDLDNHVILTDEDGNDVVFEFLDVVEYNGSEYAVLLPIENIEGGEVVLCASRAKGKTRPTSALMTKQKPRLSSTSSAKRQRWISIFCDGNASVPTRRALFAAVCNARKIPLSCALLNRRSRQAAQFVMLSL